MVGPQGAVALELRKWVPYRRLPRTDMSKTLTATRQWLVHFRGTQYNTCQIACVFQWNRADLDFDPYPWKLLKGFVVRVFCERAERPNTV
jgi:hypothetical protein